MLDLAPYIDACIFDHLAVVCSLDSQLACSSLVAKDKDCKKLNVIILRSTPYISRIYTALGTEIILSQIKNMRWQWNKGNMLESVIAKFNKDVDVYLTLSFKALVTMYQ